MHSSGFPSVTGLLSPLLASPHFPNLLASDQSLDASLGDLIQSHGLSINYVLKIHQAVSPFIRGWPFSHVIHPLLLQIPGTLFSKPIRTLSLLYLYCSILVEVTITISLDVLAAF